MLAPPGIAYERAADLRVERSFERVLVPLFCSDTDPDAGLTELLDWLSAAFVGSEGLTVGTTETAGPVV